MKTDKARFRKVVEGPPFPTWGIFASILLGLGLILFIDDVISCVFYSIFIGIFLTLFIQQLNDYVTKRKVYWEKIR